MAVKVTGEKEVLANLNRAILTIEGRTAAGIMSALSFIQDKAIAKTPVDTGNLRGSFYKKRLIFRDNFPAGEIGNTAEYALVVHENLENNHPVGEAKYLENTILENIGKIKQIITSRIKL